MKTLRQMKILFGFKLNALVGDMTQTELSEKIGISRQNLAKYLSGRALPNSYNLYQLAKYFNVSTDELLNINGTYPIKEKYEFKVSFEDGRWSKGIYSVMATSEEEAEEIALNEIYNKFNSVLPELDIEVSVELIK